MLSSRAQFISVTGFVVAVGMFFSGSLAYAQVPDVNVPDIGVPTVDVNVNPNVPSASEINCQIYADLIARGEPIPPGFDGSGCGGNGGGGGGGTTPACGDGVDNDGDNLVDSADPGCSSSTDTDESNSSGGGNGGGDNGGGSGGSGGGGGNSGGPAPACEDSVDNDGDGLKDMNDPGCSSPADSDETNSASGGGGGSAATTTSATTTAPTSATSTLAVVESCDMYLTSFIKPGAKNDSEQVKRLQSLLSESEGANLKVTGEYDAATIAAVHAFQTKYASDILTPWGAKKSTGFVYLTTKKKVNEVYCKLTKEFPLSNEEQAAIAKTKSQILSGASATNVAPAKAVTPKAKQEVKEDVESTIGAAEKESQTAAAGSESATRSLNRLWDPVTGFFKRVFGR